MAKLLRLQISGIRSFGPYEDQAQQLKFLTPLTLILGQNGCGKTTIIESIKFACSGDLPLGTNNGQGFVNDPKMTHSASTKGQIKLKISDPKGNEVTVCRIVEATQTACTVRFSTKSSTIRVVKPDGTDTSAPGRCLDVTSEFCQIMNVSPPVLNNVIFCHQENAAWPLDEGKKLKEKFDEIFDAAKYNRCTEALRKQLKTMQDRMKLLTVELDYKREKKDHVDKQKRMLQEKEDRLETFEEQVRTKSERLEPVKARIDEIFELEKELGNLEKQLTAKKATKEGVVDEQNTIKRSLAFEFDGSDDELREKIRSFEEDRAKEEDVVVQLEKRKGDVDSKAKEVAVAIQEAQTLLGKLNQERESYLKKCARRKELIQAAREMLDVKLEKDWDDNDNARYALKEFKAVAESLEIGFRCLTEEKDIEERGLQKAVDEVRENVVRTRNDIESKARLMREHEKKIEEVNNELLSLSSSDDYLKNCISKIDQIDKTLFNLNNTFKETEESQKTDSFRKDIKDMEGKLEELEAEYKILRQNDIVEGKIETENRLIMEKQREINRIKTKHSDNLKQLFGGEVPETNLKNAVFTLQSKADFAVKSLTEKINKKQKDVTTLEVHRQNQTERIAECERELKEKQKKISEACNGKDFNESLDASFQKKERLQRDKGQYSSVKVIFGQYIKEFEKESPCCPICETNFDQKGDLVKKIVATLKNKLETVPQKLAAVEEELKKEEDRYDQLQRLKTTNEEIETLKSETLPQLKRQLEEINRDLEKDKAELVALKGQMHDPQKKVDISKTIISDVASLDQNLSDVEKCQRNLTGLKGQLVQVASSKSKQEVEAEIDYVKSEVSELRMKVDAQTKKINNHRDRLQQLMNEKASLVDKQVRLKESIQSRPALEARKEELVDKISTLKDEVVELKSNLSMLEAELKSVIESKESAVTSNRQQVQEERDKLAKQKKTVQDIEKLQEEIDDYIDNKTDEKLSTIEEKLKDGKNKAETLEQTKTKILEAISKKKEDLAKQQLNFQTLKSNEILRERKVVEAKLSEEIEVLKRRIGGYNYKTVYEEKRRLTLQRENLEKEVNNLIGEKNGLKTAIEEMRQELALPENKKAHSNYMSKFYEVKIAEVASDDLFKYIVALEKAILEFHKSKMIQINKNIRELWRDIYRGNDIDYIEIKTEHSTSNTRRRSYNYKVVQVKKGVELDMRGRCSAGQKVLACLIIRMALAESLSANCGILALDEPTTNLDRENIQSLSDTLSRIVNMRQKEKNFQLLIITHDEEFLNALTRVQGVSYFYRVERDNDGFSCIKKEYAL